MHASRGVGRAGSRGFPPAEIERRTSRRGATRERAWFHPSLRHHPLNEPCTLSRSRSLRFSGFSLALRKFKTYLATVAEHQPCGEGPAGFRDEFLQQIGFAGREQFDQLFALNPPLQNGFSRLEFARLFVCLRFLTEIIRLALKHARAAARAFPQRFLSAEIKLWRRLAGFIRSGCARPGPPFAP